MPKVFTYLYLFFLFILCRIFNHIVPAPDRITQWCRLYSLITVVIVLWCIKSFVPHILTLAVATRRDRAINRFYKLYVPGGQRCHSSWQLRQTRLMECWQSRWMGMLGRKESKMEGAEPGTSRWAEESRRRKVCKLAAGGQMENARCGLRKVCGVSKREYNGV